MTRGIHKSGQAATVSETVVLKGRAMPKFEQLEDGSFQAVMVQSDAEEARIAEAIQTILRFAQIIADKPHDAAARKRERGSYLYSEVERSLHIISRETNEALRHIRFLDFPELVKPEGSA